jgi:hypothetical protein
MKYFAPILLSLPTFLSWVFFLLRLSGNNPRWGVLTIGLSFLALCACIAMSILKPEAKEWRIAAIFNAIPFVLILFVVSLLQLITSD